MNKLNSSRKYTHHFYCEKHDDGFVLITNSYKEPNEKINFCCTNLKLQKKCQIEYHGLKGFKKQWYDDTNGGFKKEYFANNIHFI